MVWIVLAILFFVMAIFAIVLIIIMGFFQSKMKNVKNSSTYGAFSSSDTNEIVEKGTVSI